MFLPAPSLWPDAHRIHGTSPGSTRYFVYDEAGHLLGEYQSSGAAVKEYVWVDDRLVAVLGSYQGHKFQYVLTDHLGTPRAVANPPTNTIIWRWHLTDSAFGDHAPLNNPDGDGANYTLNLRYPGQYYDGETGLHYNYFRDYDPSTGRYIQSDPIGLGGGQATYAYVKSNPLQFRDPLGLETEVVIWAPAGWGGSSFGHVSTNINGTTYSWGPGGMSVMPTLDYLDRNAFRSGVGNVLSLSPELEDRLQKCMARHHGKYGVLLNNCTDPIESCLRDVDVGIGMRVGDSTLPVDLGDALLNSGYVREFRFYEQRTPRQGTNAPWAR